MVFGMPYLRITQVGSYYMNILRIKSGGNIDTHVAYEIDFAGENSGVDYWYNKMPNTGWYASDVFGNYNTGNTYLFYSCDPQTGKPKEVECADGQRRVITLALTHSNMRFKLRKIYRFNEVMYSEGVAGYATGNHIHCEACEGVVHTKVRNKYGYYNLPNMLDLTKVFYILDTFTTVLDTKGLQFMATSEVTVDDGQILVTTANVNLRRGYGKNTHIITVLSKNTKVHWYWEQRNGWYKVYLPERDLQGCIYSEYLKGE